MEFSHNPLKGLGAGGLLLMILHNKLTKAAPNLLSFGMRCGFCLFNSDWNGWWVCLFLLWPKPSMKPFHTKPFSYKR